MEMGSQDIKNTGRSQGVAGIIGSGAPGAKYPLHSGSGEFHQFCSTPICKNPMPAPAKNTPANAPKTTRLGTKTAKMPRIIATRYGQRSHKHNSHGVMLNTYCAK